jgi:hypothetical protein
MVGFHFIKSIIGLTSVTIGALKNFASSKFFNFIYDNLLFICIFFYKKAIDRYGEPRSDPADLEL